jgi:hypothetical protein
MRAYEFIREVKLGPGGTVDTQPTASAKTPEPKPGVSLPRDERGWPIEPGLEPSIGPDDLIGLGAPSLAKGIAKSAQAGVRKVEPHLLGLDPTRPAVTNQLHSPRIGGSGFPAGSTQSAYNVRGVRRPEEIEDIVSSGFMNPSAKGKKYFTHTDDPQDIPGYYATVRVPSNRTPSGRAVKSKDVEVYDRDAGAWRTISPSDAPSAKQAASWEKFKQSVPGMNPVVTKEPTNAREAALQHWMREHGRPPTSSNEILQFDGLTQGYQEYLFNPKIQKILQNPKLKGWKEP